MNDEVVERRSGVVVQCAEDSAKRLCPDPAREQLVEEWLADDEQRHSQREEQRDDQYRTMNDER